MKIFRYKMIAKSKRGWKRVRYKIPLKKESDAAAVDAK